MDHHQENQTKSAFHEWVESILIALVLALFIRSYFIQPFKIPSGSMRMTLVEGDRLFVNKLRYGPKLIPNFGLFPRLGITPPEWFTNLTKKRIPGVSHFKRGDVIVFIYPADPKKDFIKRLIAFGGETVEIRYGDIYINDKKIDDPKIDNIRYANYGDYGEDNQKVQVPPGQLYVLGDNSVSSHDSRFWGFVPEENVIGKAELIFWPLDRVRIIK